MRKLYLLSTLVLSLTVCSTGVNAQDFSNKGSEFWFCFPNHIPSGASTGAMSIWITSDQASSGKISMTNGTFNATFSVAANGITSVNIPHGLAHISNAESGTVIQKSLRLTVDPGQPEVVAYAQQYGNARSAATLLLPTNVLGKKYFASSYTYSATNGGGQSSRSQFQVIATQPSTQVRVTPMLNGVKAAPFIIPLVNTGDMYQYQSTQDVTGTLIESIATATGSCLPIAVFSGSSSATIGTTTCTNPGSFDPLFQQLYPVSTWGKNYGFIPFGDYTNGNPYRVIASEDNTSIYFNNSLITTLNEGQIYPATFNLTPQVLTSATSITSDKPICVVQYAQTSACSGTNNGDPDMVILNPIEQNISDITIFTSTQQSINRQWLNVLIKTAIAPSFTIDGAPPSTAFVAAPNIPGYSYLQHLFTPAVSGSHRLYADSGFNAIAYGFQAGNFESYAYSAGTNVRDLNQALEVNNEWGIESSPNVCTNSPFKFKVYFPDKNLATPPVEIRYDSIRWSISNPGVLVPSNFPLTVLGAPTIIPDSVNIRNGKDVAWYSLPGNYTINTPGTYTITITVYRTSTEGCGNAQEYSFPLTVSSPPVASFNFTEPGCQFETVQFTETTPQIPKATYRFWWEFGDPLSGPLNNSTARNPTHIFTAPGTYNVRFMNITTAGCLSDTIPGTIIVPQLPVGTISGAITVCKNDPSPQITFSGTEGKPPYTFTYRINAGPNQTISTAAGPPAATSVTLPVPTNIPGNFRYTLVEIRNTGSTLCVQPQNEFVDVVVNDNTTLTLTSPAGSDNQTLCVNNPITNITYAIGGGGTSASVTGLPTGVNGIFAAGVMTLSGTPTVAGTFNYVVTGTGPCGDIPINGTITVNDNASISLSSPVGTDIQTVCINTAIANIQYSIGGSGTGATVTGLPAGVTGSYAGGFYTILGSPTISGVFNYTITTLGPCINQSLNGTITVTADGTITLTSPVSTSNQTLCMNVPITNITYAIGGSGTGATVSGLPTGVTGTYAAGVFTISGTPTTAGTYNYTVNSTGPCGTPSANGSITVNPDATINLSSPAGTNLQELCVNATIAQIVYAIGGGGTGATVSGLPAGVTGSFSGGNFTILGTPTASGTFNYTVTTTGTCAQVTANGTLIVNALPTASFVPSAPSCETRTITFTNTSVPNSGNITSWTWDFGDASPPLVINPPTNPNVTHSYGIANTYNVSLVVVTDKGCVSTNPAVPVIINIVPEAGFEVPEVCINDVATFFKDTSKIRSGTLDPAGYYWDFGDPASGAANFSTTRDGTHLYTAIGPYTVMHVATSANGCKDTTYNDIFINAADPVSDFRVNNLATLCANDSVSLVNLSTISQGSVTKLEIYWDLLGAPATFDLVNVPLFNGVYKHKYPTLTTTQTYTIRLVAYSGTICFSVRDIPVTVNAAPDVLFNPIPSICYDAPPYQIPPAVARETGGVIGTGIFTGPGVSPGGIFSPAVAGIGTHRILYTYTSSAAGCIDTASNLITVWDTASARIGVQPLVCERSPVSFNSNNSSIPAGNGSITGWTWNFGDIASGVANTSTNSSPSHLFTSWGNYTVTLSVLTSNGCRSTVSTEPVLVNPIARPRFDFPSSVCLPAATIAFRNLSTIPDGSESGFSYVWDFGDPPSGVNNSATVKDPSHIYNSVGPFNVNLQVIANSGCPHDTIIVVNSIHPEPRGSFTVDKTDVCIGGTFSFRSTSDPADGSTTQWFWDMADGNTRNTSSFTYLYSGVNNYPVTHYIVNSFGCRSSVATTLVSVNPYPVVDAGPRKLMLEGGAVELTPIITSRDPVTYSWTPAAYLNNPTLERPLARPPDDTYFTLVVTTSKGCSNSDTMFVKVLKKPDVPNIFSPNGDGVNDQWVIKYLDTYPGCSVNIVNRYGQLVFKSIGYPTPWDGKVNGADAPVGTYYYVIDPKNGRPPLTGYVDIIR